MGNDIIFKFKIILCDKIGFYFFKVWVQSFIGQKFFSGYRN